MGQGHSERKRKKVAFSRTSSSKVDRFTSNQDQNDHRSHSPNTYRRIHFTSEKIVFDILLLLLLLLLSVHLYSALSLQIPNALHALCQYLANRTHLSDRLK